MQFSSAIFLLFSAGAVLLYYILPQKTQWWVLLLASYGFYLSQGVRYVGFLLFTTVVTYLTGRVLSRRANAEDAFVEAHREEMDKAQRKEYRAQAKKGRLLLLSAGLIFGFGLLAVIKYTPFAYSLVGAEFPLASSWLLPLGLSFYTFQSMGYLIDLYRKKAEFEPNFFKLALFVSYFPQIVQGPISRFGDLEAQLTSPHEFDSNRFLQGSLRILFGYFKKLVVADTAMIGVRYLAANPESKTGVYVFLLILLYTAEIYGDFTGGIDITIGISQLFGISLKENFDRPFSSKSVKEYWRRWHITMGTWFTDYVFYPLSVSGGMQKLSVWSRKHLGNAIGKRMPVYLATIVTWFLTGLWHGAGLNFIVWGLLNCLAILVSQELQPLFLKFSGRFPKLTASRGWGIFQTVRTFLLMGLFRSLDVYRDVPLTFSLWGTMFTDFNWGEPFAKGVSSFGMTVPQLCVLLCGVAVLFVASQSGKKKPVWISLSEKPILSYGLISLFLLLILVFGSYGIGYDASDFIYGQF